MFENQPSNQALPPTNLPTEPEDMLAGVEQEPAAGSTPVEPTSAMQAGLLKKKMPSVSAMAPAIPESMSPPLEELTGVMMKKPVIGKIFIVVGVILVISVIGFAGVWFFGQRNNSSSPLTAPPTVTEPEPSPPAPAAPAPEAAAPQPPPAPLTASSAADVALKTKSDKILFGEQVDADKDGIADSHEQELGTNPNNPDTDRDGLTDGEEVAQYHTNPLNPDSDGDGLSDGDEIKIWHTDPLNPDTDHDGYPDGTEVKNGYNPLGSGRMPSGSPSSTVVTSSAKSSAAASSSLK